MKSRERILFSEPPADLEEFQDMRRVGVVKPYAVVELNNTNWIASSQENLCGMKSLTLSSGFHRSSFSPPPLPRPRGTSLSAVTIRSTMSPIPYKSSTMSLTPYKSSTNPRSMSSSKQGKIIPKRKAPPPPPNCNRRKNVHRNRSSSVPPQSSTDLLDELLNCPQTVTKTTCKSKTVSRVNTPSVIELRPKESSPPRKPPRTQSTFFTELPPSSSQLSLVYPFEAVTADKSIDDKHKQSLFKPPASDYEPLRKPGYTMGSMSLIASPTVLEQLHEIFNDSLDSLSSKCLYNLSFVKQLWNAEWSDITVRTDEHNNHQLFYHMHPINVEVYITIISTKVCTIVLACYN